MKGLFLFVVMFFSFFTYGQESLKFEVLKQDLGELKEGQIKEVSFYYENVSNNSLLLEDVIPQCGCTVASFDDKLLLPGEEAIITLSFDSKNKQGLQRKTVSVLLKNGERYVLVITANVLLD